MKCFMIVLLFLPFLMYGQTEILLTVDQSAELGYTMANPSASIVNGESLVLGVELSIFGGSGNYQYGWSPGKSLNDSTILHPIAKPGITTDYLLTIYDASGCNLFVSQKVIVEEFPSAIQQSMNENMNLEVVLFPNPNVGSFKIQLTGERRERIDLRIVDNSGQIIYEKSILNFTGDQTESFDLHFPAGIYMLQANSGKQTLQRPFIIY